jgi:carbon monoxide dehydrogenase subunit G
MSVVRVQTEIAAAPERVWEKVMDPQCLSHWVTIHRELRSASSGEAKEGATMEQVLALRGVPFTVNWRLKRCEPARLAVWEGKGPAGSRAITCYELAPGKGGGTCFDYTNEFSTPGGMLGKMASRVLVAGVSEREAQSSLERLKHLLEDS